MKKEEPHRGFESKETNIGKSTCHCVEIWPFCPGRVFRCLFHPKKHLAFGCICSLQLWNAHLSARPLGHYCLFLFFGTQNPSLSYTTPCWPDVERKSIQYEICSNDPMISHVEEELFRKQGRPLFISIRNNIIPRRHSYYACKGVVIRNPFSSSETVSWKWKQSPWPVCLLIIWDMILHGPSLCLILISSSQSLSHLHFVLHKQTINSKYPLATPYLIA